MTLERLDNLVKTGEVHEEASDQGEFERLVSMARRRLADSQVSGLSEEGQFLAAYTLPTHWRLQPCGGTDTELPNGILYFYASNTP